MRQGRLFFLSFFIVILVYTIILLPLSQVWGVVDDGVIKYRLDQKTVEKGFPVFSKDKDFSLMVLKAVFDKPINVSLESQESAGALRAYYFKITEEETVPLIKKPLAVIFYNIDPEVYRYARIYYYYAPQKIWLGLTTKFDKKRKILMSDRIDFAQGIVGAFVGSDPLPDRIEEAKFKAENSSEDTDASYTFTALFDDAIIERGFTIDLDRAHLSILPRMLNASSVVSALWSDEDKILKYDISPLQYSVSPLKENGFIVISFRKSKDAINFQSIAYWDNNKNAWQSLPTVYNEKIKFYIAKSPFHFGKYTTYDKKDAYTGKASWFKDNLISKTTFSAASNDYPYGSYIKVTNLANQKKVRVQIFSTGPYVEGRIIDLSKSAFSKIAHTRDGVIEVVVEKIDKD